MDGLSAREALILLAHCAEPADAAVGRLVDEDGPVAAIEAVRRQGTGMRHEAGLLARLAGVDPDSADERAESLGARIVTRVDREWPTQLDDLGPSAPMALWVRGAADLRLLALRAVSVVGARACSAYGEEVARSWCAELAQERWCVLSGAAYGIDAAAHRGALAADGATIAVLAGGVDVAYPRAHEALLARIVDDGLVLSESPPGESVRRQRFLSRNRVIAALGRVTLVVEAAERSGTTATAHAAGQMNRPVLAVPGPVTSPTSAGCHRMIREGEALLVADTADLLDLLDLGRSRPVGGRAPSSPAAADVRDRLSPRERTVLDALPSRGVCGLDALVRSAGLAAPDVLAAATVLVAHGLVRQESTGWRLVSSTVAQG